MKIGFYAGSFDPFTNGHLEVLKKASLLFDKVFVGLGVNPDKKSRFNDEQMKTAIEKVFKTENIKNAEVVIYKGLTVDAANECGCTFLIRGIRNGIDYDYEENLANINEEVSGLDTIFVRAGKFGFVSSSMVCELFKNKKDVSKYVPKEILEVMQSNDKF